MNIVHGYDVEPDLVNARQGPSPDWVGLYPVCSTHVNGRPTSEQFSFCHSQTREEHDQLARCYACSWEVCCECADTLLTPRCAATLHVGATVLADTMREDLYEYARVGGRPDPASLTVGLPFTEFLPPVVCRQLTFEFAQRYVACFDTLAGRLAAGRGLSPNCTAEEAAVHHLIDIVATEFADASTREDYTHWTRGLPAVGDADYDFERVRDFALEDHDVLMLFDPALDGIEEPDSTAAQWLGVVNLQPADWFKPFRDRSATMQAAA